MYPTPTVVTWQTVSEPPALAADGLHLWYLATDRGDAAPRRGLDWLSPEQRQRADAMRNPEVRNRYLHTQIGLRRILSGYLGHHPRDLVIARANNGKPFVADQPGGLEFNLSTTEGLTLIGVGRHEPLGVDCERLRTRTTLDAIARRLFEPSIAAAIEAAGPDERIQLFHLAWTALEADVKADGRGLFRSRPATAPAPTIRHLIPAAGYVAAVARIGLPPRRAWLTLMLRDDAEDTEG